MHDHLSPLPTDGVDEEVGMLASCLKNGNMRKLELTKCHDLSPVQIATILSGLKENSSLEELVVTLDHWVSYVRKCDYFMCTRSDGSDTKPTGQF